MYFNTFNNRSFVASTINSTPESNKVFMIFSYISANGVSHLNLFSAILILILVIGIGIFFDIIGVAVTVANEQEFHAEATKKVKGSKDSIKLIRNAPKVANICADVIGDICRST